MSIKIRDLRKSFGSLNAINGLSLHIAEGKMLVLLGPSGCGKTTTMRCIAGLERPSSGTISIGGETVFDSASNINTPINRRNVGMVFQSYAIWPHMSVFENVAFPLRVKNIDRKETADRVGDILSKVGLADFAKRGASNLSGGQMQRVALARSLVMRPSVLLFDEPLSNLDARLRDRLRIQLRELQTQFNITSVYVTHDQSEALALADQIAVLHHGELLQLADPVTIYSRPNSSTVADFLGYSNIFSVAEMKTINVGKEVVLKEGNMALRSSAVPDRELNSPHACIRPEDIDIGPWRDGVFSDDGDNQLTGEVLLASFMGSLMQYRVRTRGGVIFEIFSRKIDSEIKLGDRVLLGIRSDRVHILPQI
jgi:iron(III) transport system ATP-binding protein